MIGISYNWLRLGLRLISEHEGFDGLKTEDSQRQFAMYNGDAELNQAVRSIEISMGQMIFLQRKI